MASSTPSIEDFLVVWIAALPLELAAALAMLDEEYQDAPDDFDLPATDSNTYRWGKCGKHNIILTSLPRGEYGIGAATRIAERIVSTLPHIRIGLMVGIAAGITRGKSKDIRLGDVAVSIPEEGRGGVVQYDFRKAKSQDGISSDELVGHLNSPPEALLTALASLEATIELGEMSLESHVNHAFARKPSMKQNYDFPGCDKDPIRKPGFAGSSKSSQSHEPTVFFGTIASANTLMKNAAERDRIMDWLAKKDIHPICLEMEAAGLMKSFPCIIVRGICDYADESKNDDWQRYAAMTASAFARVLLSHLNSRSLHKGQTLRDTFLQIRVSIDGIHETTTEMRKGNSLDYFGKVLSWLCLHDYTNDFERHFQTLLPGTAQWILRQEVFLDWKTRPDGSALLCHGDPGIGKTMVMTAVIAHFRKSVSGRAPVLYIYCDHKASESTTLSFYLASLLGQALRYRGNVPEHVRELYHAHVGSKLLPDADVLQQSLEATLTDLVESTIVIDALDECNPAIAQHLIPLLTSLTRVNTRSLVSSRSLPEIKQLFCDSAQLSIQVPKEDINAYVYHRTLSLEQRINVSTKLHEQVVSAVIQAAEGLFLLASLLVDSLCRHTNARDVQSALKTLPAGYNEAYKDTMGRIQNSDMRELAMTSLKWIVYARRPLTMLELQHALATRLGDIKFDPAGIPRADLILSSCCGLLVANVPSGVQNGYATIGLFHLTAQDYLRENHPNFFPAVKMDLATTCLTYLALDDFTSGPKGTEEGLANRRSEFPLLDYVCHCLGEHLQEIDSVWSEDEEHVPAALRAAMYRFSNQRGSLDTAYEITSHGIGFVTKITIWHFIASWDLITLLRALLDRLTFDDTVDSRGYSSLAFAVDNGSLKVAAELLERGICDPATQTYRKKHTPLTAAVLLVYPQMVELLLRYNVTIDQLDDKGWTAKLHAANLDDNAVLDVFLRFEDASEETGQSTLQSPHAFSPDKWRLEKRIEIRRIQLNRPIQSIYGGWNGHGEPPLIEAARSGNLENLRVLLASSIVDSNVTGPDGNTAIVQAIKDRRFDVLTLLLSAKDIKVDVRDRGGRTPLSHACARTNVQMVEAILEKDAVDADSVDDLGRTPLCYAALGGNLEVIELLLRSNRVNIDHKDKDCRAPISLACRSSSWQTVAKLLESEQIDINAADDFGTTPLHEAVNCGRTGAVAVLLKSKLLRIDALDNQGRTPLSHICDRWDRSSSDIRTLLLLGGAQPQIADHSEESPLHFAVNNGRGDHLSTMLAFVPLMASAISRSLLHTALRRTSTSTRTDLVARVIYHIRRTNQKGNIREILERDDLMKNIDLEDLDDLNSEIRPPLGDLEDSDEFSDRIQEEHVRYTRWRQVLSQQSLEELRAKVVAHVLQLPSSALFNAVESFIFGGDAQAENVTASSFIATEMSDNSAPNGSELEAQREEETRQKGGAHQEEEKQDSSDEWSPTEDEVFDDD